ncbi:MAG: sigma-70 family RNA polymerase sigma factor [Streptosporangiales bacterium]|nr:sigma-70 family RNA polymerase sigma factor [Streptosporangiales bacterium]
MALPEDDERPLTQAEIDAFRRDDLFIRPDEVGPDFHPRLTNISVGFTMKGIARALNPAPVEYVAIDVREDDDHIKEALAIHKWNQVWEFAQFRRRYFDEDELPEQMARIADLGDLNVCFVPRTVSRYHEYTPLLYLLPATTLERFGLPLFRAGQWPYGIGGTDVDRYLPADFEGRLGRAWAWTVWPHLNSGSGPAAFSKDDPIKLLAHNLDFWVPAVTEVIQQTLRGFPEVDEGVESGPVELVDGSLLEGAVAANPRIGGPIWMGAAEAAEKVAETVAAADATGQLRGILDAVKSNRVQDDFSPRWSFAREDFERRLYSKRSKVSVKFVELTDTIPVQGPDSEVIGKLITNDFLAMLDGRNQEIVVLLNSGVTSRTEIAQILGYANHSAVSKRLDRIRQQAAEFFGLD